MPELPEVETIRRELNAGLRGLRVRSVLLRRPEVVTGTRTPKALLRGTTFGEPARHGKQLALVAEPGDESAAAIAVHLGMSGQLLLVRPGEAPARVDHVHVEWILEDSAGGDRGRLLFRDPRRFGGVWTFPTFGALRAARWAELGPDAGAGPVDDRLLEFKSSARSVKATLLDQAVIAGVGNIYADEALFEAGIRPTRPMRRLRPKEAVRLSDALRAVLDRAIAARGSTLRDYRTSAGDQGGFQLQHRVYGRAGQPCVRCGAPLQSGVVGQRTTVWCRGCQK